MGLRLGLGFRPCPRPLVGGQLGGGPGPRQGQTSSGMEFGRQPPGGDSAGLPGPSLGRFDRAVPQPGTALERGPEGRGQRFFFGGRGERVQAVGGGLSGGGWEKAAQGRPGPVPPGVVRRGGQEKGHGHRGRHAPPELRQGRPAGGGLRRGLAGQRTAAAGGGAAGGLSQPLSPPPGVPGGIGTGRGPIPPGGRGGGKGLPSTAPINPVPVTAEVRQFGKNGSGCSGTWAPLVRLPDPKGAASFLVARLQVGRPAFPLRWADPRGQIKAGSRLAAPQEKSWPSEFPVPRAGKCSRLGTRTPAKRPSAPTAASAWSSPTRSGPTTCRPPRSPRRRPRPPRRVTGAAGAACGMGRTRFT